MIYIYALIDGRTGEARYVGWTTDYRSRLRQHVALALRGEPSHRSRWLRRLLADGATPRVVVLETDPVGGWAAAERAWIATLAAIGCRLTNMTVGGDGVLGHRHTPETRARIGDAQRGRPRTSETRARIGLANRATAKGRTLSPDARRKLRAANLGKTLSPETRAKVSAAKTGHTVTPETRAKIGAASRAMWAARAGRPSVEQAVHVTALSATGASQRAIAVAVGVSRDQVRRLLRPGTAE